jgi:hypothetical protein
MRGDNEQDFCAEPLKPGRKGKEAGIQDLRKIPAKPISL